MSNIRIIDRSNDDDTVDVLEFERKTHNATICETCKAYLNMVEKKESLFNEEFAFKIMDDVDAIIEHNLLHGVIDDTLNKPLVRDISATVAACLLHFNHICISNSGLSGDLQLLRDTIPLIIDELMRILKKSLDDEEHLRRS